MKGVGNDLGQIKIPHKLHGKSREGRNVLEQVVSCDTAKVFTLVLRFSRVLTKVPEKHEESVNTTEHIM